MDYVHFLERLAQSAELDDEPIPGQTLVELNGDGRVLVENHAGVSCYSPTQIGIQVSYGTLFVTGCALEIKLMTARRLVIIGKIECVRLQRKGRA